MIEPFEKPIYVTKPVLPDLKEIGRHLEEVWGTGQLTNKGPKHEKLERELERALKVPHLSLFNNGTIALLIAIQNARLTGEVITTPFTFPATTHALPWNGIEPIFCDIDPVTMNIDAAKIESMITPRTTGILAVHVFGTPCDVYAIQDIADRYGLKVIYDAAHAFMTEIDGVGIGNFGDATMFSFHATKLFHTAEGGALALKDQNQKQRVDFLKNFGIKNENDVLMPGINGKMNEVQAVMGLVVLDMVADEQERRKQLKAVYTKALSSIEGITLPAEQPGVRSSEQYFVIRIDGARFGRTRDEVHAELKAMNVITRKYFYPLCSDCHSYRQLPSSSVENLPVANTVVKEVLTLPYYGSLALRDAERICEMIISLRRR